MIEFNLYVITDRHRCAPTGLLTVISELLDAGARAIQLREKDLDAPALYQLAKPIAERCRRYDAALFINGNVKVALDVGAAGVHLPASVIARLKSAPTEGNGMARLKTEGNGVVRLKSAPTEGNGMARLKTEGNGVVRLKSAPTEGDGIARLKSAPTGDGIARLKSAPTEGNGPVGALCKRASETLQIGCSIHNFDEAKKRETEGADFITYSPIYLTASKPGYGPAVGVANLAKLAKQVKLPIFALGGITPARVAACMEAGAAGIAVMSGVMSPTGAGEQAKRYLDALRETEMLVQSI